MTSLPYLEGYEPDLQARVETLLNAGELGPRLAERYPDTHEVHSSKALSTYVQDLKARYMQNAAALGKVFYDDRMLAAQSVLGLHVTTTRMQGAKIRKRRELRVASLFKETPPEFLRMIVVHELAHMKHAAHDRDFYKLCTYMEPEYHQYELDLRLYLTAKEWQGCGE